MLKAREKGRPRSRAKDQVMRDAAARQPIALQNSRSTMMDTMTVAPAFEPTAWWNMLRKGAVWASWSWSRRGMLSALKRTAKSMPRARVPLMARLRSMERGTSVLAFLTSSDIYFCRYQHGKSWKVGFLSTYVDDRVCSDKSQGITL